MSLAEYLGTFAAGTPVWAWVNPANGYAYFYAASGKVWHVEPRSNGWVFFSTMGDRTNITDYSWGYPSAEAAIAECEALFMPAADTTGGDA